MNSAYIIEKAGKTAELTGTRDPFTAATDLGVQVFFKDLGTLKGAYLGNMAEPAIIVCDRLDDNMQKIVCAHELGHHILHEGLVQSCNGIGFDSASDIGRTEREANVFAAAFLIDAEQAKEYLNDGHTADEAAAMSGAGIDLFMFLMNVYGLTDAPDSRFLK